MDLFKNRIAQVLKSLFLIVLPITVGLTLLSFGMVYSMEYYGDVIMRIMAFALLCVVIFIFFSASKDLFIGMKNGFKWLFIEPYQSYKKEKKQ